MKSLSAYQGFFKHLVMLKEPLLSIKLETWMYSSGLVH